jgi:hypothetical protein
LPRQNSGGGFLLLLVFLILIRRDLAALCLDLDMLHDDIVVTVEWL